MPNERARAPLQVRVSEDEAHRLLARAAELDAGHSLELSVEQLREIAKEAEIAPEAFEQALRELEADRREGRSWQPTSRAAESSRWSLSERLAHYRRHVALACVVGTAFLTPGDMVMTLGLYSASLYALYEIAIVAARSRDRSGPSHSRTSGNANEQRGKAADERGSNSVNRRLSLRPI